MRVSEKFNLARSQGALDFVDVDTTGDVPVFIDPRAARRQHGAWGEACREMLESHFHEVLEAVDRGDRSRLHTLLGTGEPNETHLGLSTGSRSRGRGAREHTADEIVDLLASSSAASRGLLANLEDAMLLVPDVGPDLISDQATHILRGPLIGYTQRCCSYYGIPMETQFSGPVWNPGRLEWQAGQVGLPRTEAGTLLLVPKSIVRHNVSVDAGRYYNGFLAPLLERSEIISETNIVETYLNGRQYVLRDNLKAKYPVDKLAIVDHTALFPEAMKRYRESEMVDQKYPPLDHADFSEKTHSPKPNFIELYESVEAVKPGQGGAHAYHMAVESLLTALLWPSIGNMKIEKEIHEGRKRIDIAYDNISTVGFFQWLSLHYPSAIIPVECKNYSKDVANEELDQLSGRFSRDRGRVGFLVSRQFKNKERFLNRCRDTAKDDRGWIIALDDEDLRSLANEGESLKSSPRAERMQLPLLRERFDRLIN